MRRRLARTFTIGGLLLAGLAATGCGGEEANTATIGASEFEFTVSGADFTSGTNEITLENTGQQEHHVQLLKLADGHGVDELVAALADPTAGFPEWMTADGGVGVVGPGASAVVTQDLEAGTYALLCFVEDPADGAPHFAKGMAAEIDVSGVDRSGASLPESDIEYTASEYGFDGPTTVDAGEINIGFVNSRSSAEIHEAGLLKLGEGVTTEMLAQALSGPAEGPPPFESLGGLQAYAAGGGGVATVDLEPGNYVLICFVPNPEGVPHAALGMFLPLTVE